MLSRTRFGTLALLALVTACNERGPSTAPDVPSRPDLEISDGSRPNGNANFFFLPPFARHPRNHPNFDRGAFNPGLQPVVEVCRLDPTAIPAHSRCVAGPPMRRFAGREVHVFPFLEAYTVFWNTYPDRLGIGQIYRLAVSVAGVQLGFMDMIPKPTLRGVLAVQTNEFVPFVSGFILPVSFRIERGALSSSGGPCPDCAEVVVGNTGGTYVLGTETGSLVLTSTGFAGAFFPNGWLNGVTVGGAPLTNAVVAIARRQVAIDNNCFGPEGVGLLQFEGCYEYEIYGPSGPVEIVFATPVTAGQCIEAGSANPFYDNLLLHANDNDEPLRALEAASAPFIDAAACTSGFGGSPFLGSGAFLDRMGDGLLKLAMHVGRAIAPRQAWAVDQGLGGRLDRFSRVGWAVARAVSAFAGTGQSAAPGSLLAVAPEVLVTTRHGDVVPLAGVPVTFTITAGGGSLSATAEIPITTVTVTTGANGRASVPWRLGATAGTNTLVATVAGAPASVTFGATGVSGLAMIAGTVTNARGAPLQGVEVAINSLEFSTTTNAGGQYSFSLPPDGVEADTRTLSVDLAAYGLQTRAILLESGAQVHDFVLLLEGPIDFERYDDGAYVSCEGACVIGADDFTLFGLRVDFAMGSTISAAELRVGSTGYAVTNPDICIEGCVPAGGTIRLHIEPGAPIVGFQARGPVGFTAAITASTNNGPPNVNCLVTDGVTERTYQCSVVGSRVVEVRIAATGVRFWVDNVSISP